ncbi:MAG TPA: 6-phosphogluconolactonase [Gemmatimonadales bacterium]|nr:6-phosphogluconolactonase [Gemmatimonadales bacterium]
MPRSNDTLGAAFDRECSIGDVNYSRVVVAEGPALARATAAWLVATIRQAILQRGRCTVGLAGGVTPGPIYGELTTPSLAQDIDWTRVDVYFGDERAVPPHHPDSNYRMVRERLLAHVPIPATMVHRMEAERPDLDVAAAEYDRALPPRLDVLLLGMGPDGHTASLFPRSPALAERERRVVPVHSPKPPSLRLTITPPVIAAARSVAVVAVGEEKAAMTARALAGPFAPQDVPAQLARHGTWFLDPRAAALLAPQRGAR